MVKTIESMLCRPYHLFLYAPILILIFYPLMIEI